MLCISYIGYTLTKNELYGRNIATIDSMYVYTYIVSKERNEFSVRRRVYFGLRFIASYLTLEFWKIVSHDQQMKSIVGTRQIKYYCILCAYVMSHNRPYAMHAPKPLDASTKTFTTKSACASKNFRFPAIHLCPQLDNIFCLHLRFDGIRFV